MGSPPDVTFHVEPADRSVGIMAEGFTAYLKETWCELADVATGRCVWHRGTDDAEIPPPVEAPYVEPMLRAFAETFYDLQAPPFKPEPITVAHLRGPTKLTSRYPSAHLYCDECGAFASAEAGDYWDRAADHVFEHCGAPMRLIVKRTLILDVEDTVALRKLDRMLR